MVLNMASGKRESGPAQAKAGTAPATVGEEPLRLSTDARVGKAGKGYDPQVRKPAEILGA